LLVEKKLSQKGRGGMASRPVLKYRRKGKKERGRNSKKGRTTLLPGKKKKLIRSPGTSSEKRKVPSAVVQTRKGKGHKLELF